VEVSRFTSILRSTQGVLAESTNIPKANQSASQPLTKENLRSKSRPMKAGNGGTLDEGEQITKDTENETNTRAKREPISIMLL